MKDTKGIAYKRLLQGKESQWKKLFDVQRPYRANLRRLSLGHTLEIGCGIGRNLSNLKKLGLTVIGVDHNKHSILEAQRRGFNAFNEIEFKQRYGNQPKIFDSILISHVLEHMKQDEAVNLIRNYLYLLKPKGKVVLITPQERGFDSDPTHIEFMDSKTLESILKQSQLQHRMSYSFPFPRFAGKLFIYNEFVTVGIKP